MRYLKNSPLVCQYSWWACLSLALQCSYFHPQMQSPRRGNIILLLFLDLMLSLSEIHIIFPGSGFNHWVPCIVYHFLAFVLWSLFFWYPLLPSNPPVNTIYSWKKISIGQWYKIIQPCDTVVNRVSIHKMSTRHHHSSKMHAKVGIVAICHISTILVGICVWLGAESCQMLGMFRLTFHH